MYVFVVLSSEPVERRIVRVGTEKINSVRFRKNYNDIQRIIMYKMSTYRGYK